MHNQPLRVAIAAVETNLRAAQGGSAAALETLGAAWAELVKLLAVPPAPELRECPACHAKIMRAATLCGHCWERSSAGPEAH